MHFAGNVRITGEVFHMPVYNMGILRPDWFRRPCKKFSAGLKLQLIICALHSFTMRSIADAALSSKWKSIACWQSRTF